MLLLNRKKKTMLKENGKKKMHQLQKHILFFYFIENYYVPQKKKKNSKNSLNMVKKSNFVKEDKIIVRSSHPPLDTFIINCKGTEIKASPFKISKIIDVNTPISTKTKRSLNKTILLIIPYILLANNSTVLKKKLKNLLLQKLKNL